MSAFLNNHYDILYKEPALEGKELEIGKEKLARKMVARGLLRVSAHERCNFIILPVNGGEQHLTFSRRELYNKHLLNNTIKTISEYLEAGERVDAYDSIERRIQLMRQDLGRYLEVPIEQEMKIARMLVQSVPPVIVANLINDKINFFVSYSHNIADLLDVRMWQRARYSQGLQSNDFEEASIFVSTGGNPFFDPEESNNEYDGFKARARLMVVAAQEIAHYADIIKDSNGNNVDRFSCRVDMAYPKKRCEDARQADMRKTKKIKSIFLKLGVQNLYNLERRLEIQTKYRKYSFASIALFIRKYLAEKNFRNKCQKRKINFVERIKPKGTEGLGKTILLCCDDMFFNLEPTSQAYRNPDKNREKAIMCAEALARVPQQEVKWGKEIMNIFMPNLSRYFYEEVMKEENDYFQMMNGRKFEINMSKPKTNISSILRKLNNVKKK